MSNAAASTAVYSSCYRHEPDSWLLTHLVYVSLLETVTVLGIGQNRKLNEQMTWQSQSAAKTAIVREQTLRRYFERPNGRANTSEEVCWHGSTQTNTPSAPPLHHRELLAFFAPMLNGHINHLVLTPSNNPRTVSRNR